MRPVLLIPGIHNSGPQHWQSLWQKQHANVLRVEQSDWAHLVCSDWVQALDAAVAGAAEPPILVAHSLGCLAAVHWTAYWAAHWAARHEGPAPRERPVHALLLVAVPDPLGPDFPTAALGFAPLPQGLPPMRHVTLVSSTDDPYSPTEFSKQCAAAWGAEHVVLGAAGHVNADSGLGAWPAGWELVQRWR